jgi:DNA ligase-associated metallophosphoesterase
MDRAHPTHGATIRTRRPLVIEDPMLSEIDFTLDSTLTTLPDSLSLRLYAEGALFWPDEKTLFITDPHFGKADSFHHAGIGIPTTLVNHDLARLAKLLTASQATRLVILGDFFHTRHSQSETVLRALEAWRSQFTTLEVLLVLGNHDAHAGVPPVELKIHAVVAPLLLGPFHCYHLPQSEPPTAGYSLAGHIHPCVIMRDRDGSTLRLSSFIFSPSQAILPAFGAFTGGHTVAPSPRDRVFVIAHGEIVEVPTTRSSSKRSTRT